VGLGLQQIARSCSIGLGTVHEYLQRAEAAGVTWPLREDWDKERLEAALFGGPPRAHPAALPMPDFAELHKHRQAIDTRFCELFKRWRRKQDVVLRQKHKSGEKLLVDWAGTTIPIAHNAHRIESVAIRCARIAGNRTHSELQRGRFRTGRAQGLLAMWALKNRVVLGEC
jgi:hypothetical protein